MLNCVYLRYSQRSDVLYKVTIHSLFKVYFTMFNIVLKEVFWFCLKQTCETIKEFASQPITQTFINSIAKEGGYIGPTQFIGNKIGDEKL